MQVWGRRGGVDGGECGGGATRRYHPARAAPGGRQRRRELVANGGIIVAEQAGLARDVHEDEDDITRGVHCLESHCRMRS